MAVIVEDFEDDTLAVSVTGDWTRTDVQPLQGGFCYRSAVIEDDQTSDVVVAVPPGATTVEFWYRVSSEATYDIFDVFLDMRTALQLSGDVEWTYSGRLSVVGVSHVTFLYSKDGSQFAGEDAAFIDQLIFNDAPAVWSNSFDGGSPGALITPENSAAGGDPFNNVVGVAEYSSAHFFATSGVSARNPNPGADTHVDWRSVTQPGDVVCARLYLRQVGPWTSTAGVFALLGPAGVVVSKAWLFSDGLVRVYSGHGDVEVATVGTALPINQWVRIELRYTINSAGNGTVEVWTYHTPDSATHTATAISSTVAWPGGKPADAEFHLFHGTGGDHWHMDGVAVGPTKLGPVAFGAAVRSRTSIPAGARHRAATR
ncbi:hypothetical protein [Nonomuraea basaltis]|uniref:hypothetical protein n=1 Tax=Nonomuraea basaltis TaxID=2495887 RepID=UPI00110C4AC2|nr:hypothetical protein [Nonomuraea basaltis]TMR97549.1 hypothetical protein EJK15_17670 [Nonomuraea basaltis]